MKTTNVIIAVLFVFQTSCSTFRKNEGYKTIGYMGVAAAGGAAIGYATHPEGEKAESHAGLWAAIFAVGTALYRIIFVHTPQDREYQALKYKNENVRQMISSDGTIEFVADEHKKRGHLKGKYKSYPNEDIIPSPENDGEYLHVIKVYKPLKKDNKK